MKINILNVKINTETRTEILSEIRAQLDSNKTIFIVTPYSESLVAAQTDGEFRDILNTADFALPDGAGVLWAAKKLERKIPERIPGREFFWDLCALAEKRGESIFLLGGYNDTPEIVVSRLKAKFPNLKIAGTYNNIVSSLARRRREPNRHPELDPRSPNSGSEAGMTTKAIEAINQADTSFLFVALGPVAQEKWIHHNLPNLHVKLAMGVGGTFDYIAGKRPLPPHFLSRRGLEWLWRLLTQPWRMFRIAKGVLGLVWYTARSKT